jgi:hypothetical protein
MLSSPETRTTVPAITNRTSIHVARNGLLRVFYLGLITCGLFAAFYNWSYDDAFITYRYALNLSDGLGFVYNPGQRTLSTTTPLFTLLLAAGSSVWKDTPRLANIINAFSAGLGALFLFELCRLKNLSSAGWASLALYPTFPQLVTTIGLEIPLFLALCLGTMVFYERKNFSLSALFAALVCLTRPDGVLLALVLLGHYLLKERRMPPLKPILLFVIFLLPWFLFTLIYFGTPIPVALTAKQHQGSMAISERFAPGLLTVIKPYASHWVYWVEGGLALVGIVTALLRHRQWTYLFVWTALYFVTYTALGVSRYPWYYTPLVPGFVIAICLGLALIEKFYQVAPNGALPIHSQAITAFVIFLLTIGQVDHLWQIRSHPDNRIDIYRAAGEWLKDNTPEQALVGTLEVGIIGYYSHRPMLDFAGLLQPEIAAQLTPESDFEDAAIWASNRFHPQILVLKKGDFQRLEQGYASHYCRVMKSFMGDIFDYPGDVDIYSCVTVE